MKTNKYQPRFYRNWLDKKELFTKHIVVGESDILISSDVDLDEDFLRARISDYRKNIAKYILCDRNFSTSLTPIRVSKGAPLIVKDMAEAAKKSGVGPMAAVAGAIADYLAKDLKNMTKELIIENGGDIFLKTKTKRRIGIYAGDSKLSGKIVIEIDGKKTPLGVCTSSGTVGHSLNFGITDATVIVAKTSTLADAVATATSNIVKKSEDIKKAINFAKSIQGVTAILIIVKDLLSAWGDIKIEKAK
ncbi:MAG: UPF0280 family protein [Candidatus Omnitrophica bacterium]|nr:UPF0280 family protein [Candidatus Omnitrophota bacterium]HOX54677.1 UPF0280 family protein [Candidatus Omnitrophota bacterium]